MLRLFFKSALEAGSRTRRASSGQLVPLASGLRGSVLSEVTNWGISSHLAAATSCLPFSNPAGANNPALPQSPRRSHLRGYCSSETRSRASDHRPGREAGRGPKPRPPNLGAGPHWAPTTAYLTAPAPEGARQAGRCLWLVVWCVGWLPVPLLRCSPRPLGIAFATATVPAVFTSQAYQPLTQKVTSARPTPRSQQPARV